jgi:hypothetical protein
MGVAEADENLGLLMAFALLPKVLDGLFVVDHGTPVIAKVHMGVAETLQRCRLAAPIADLSLDGQSLLTQLERRLEVPKASVLPTDDVERPCLSGEIVQVSVLRVCRLAMSKRFAVPALLAEHDAESKDRFGCPSTVTDAV